MDSSDQREAIVTPTGGGPYSWAVQGQYPVSYSFTITNFPPEVANHGFEAHMYLVNGDTDGSQPTWNSTYGGVDWNVPDILKFSVENNAAGGAIARISWKTNLPNGNPPGDELHNPVIANGPTAHRNLDADLQRRHEWQSDRPGRRLNELQPASRGGDGQLQSDH